MILPGATNSIGDVAGLRVGHAEDRRLRSGVSVVVPDRPAVAAVDVRGGGPGTRETDALAPGALVQHVHGLVLSGGSAFGLDAAGGLMGWLAARGRGFRIRDRIVPVVPAAILFDLANGGDKEWGETSPYPALARQAADAALADPGQAARRGKVGAGYGALAGRLEGGLASASAVDEATGITVAAMVAVNSSGSVAMPDGTFWAWHLEQAGEMGGQTPPTAGVTLEPELKKGPGENTTIGMIATDAMLDRQQLLRLALMGHAGIARAIRPSHTPFDGDTLFALATGTAPVPERRDLLTRLGHMAADCVARAICRAVLAAESLGTVPAYAMLHGNKLERRAESARGGER